MQKTITLILFGCFLFLAGCTPTEDVPEEIEYTITFESNGGTEVESVNVLEGSAISELTHPEKEGFSFLGWTLVDTPDAEVVSVPFEPEASVVLYAQWSINQYTIAFESNGGSVVSQIVDDFDSPVTEPDEPTKEGYTFGGWYSDQELTTEYMFSTMPSEDIELYAKWTINQYTISFDVDGGTTVMPITQDYNTLVTEPEEPTKEGFTFGGWYMNPELTILYVFTTIPANDVTLYAKWIEIDWTEVEEYLSTAIPDSTFGNLTLPTTYLTYSISWQSSEPEIISDSGIYTRPYQATVVQLTATIESGQQSITRRYDIDVDGYKSLSAPLLSSYIYRDYHMVTDSFFETLDVINCAFIYADSNGDLSGTAVLNNINNYIMPKAREHGNWVLFSVAPSSEWSDIVSTRTRMISFADNIVAMINQYGFDGVDIDWETPEPAEATKFTELMELIYTKVKENNPNHLVTAAIAGGMWQPPRYDLPNSHQYLDYINMMTYGMVNNNGYYQNALYKSTIFDDAINSAGKTLTSCSIEESVAIYQSYGIPNSKIIVGVAFYGIMQTRTYNTSTQTWSSWTKEGSVSYTYIQNNYLSNSAYQYHYDNNAGVPYIVSTDGSVFISYDNPRSILDKSEYILEQGLGGMMYWENGLDSTGNLLQAMSTGLED
jgi:chitinase